MGVQRLVETFSVVFLIFHAVSVSANPGDFSCSGKKNGALSADRSRGCHAFKLCWDGVSHEGSCDDTCTFDEQAQTCLTSDTCNTGGNTPAFCDHGQYMVFPGDNNQYVQYGVGTAHLKQCSPGLIFDTSVCTCNFDNGY